MTWSTSGSRWTAARSRTRPVTTSRPARTAVNRLAAGGDQARRPSAPNKARRSIASLTTCLRHEAQCYIARVAGRDEMSYLWIKWLTQDPKGEGTIARQETGGCAQA